MSGFARRSIEATLAACFGILGGLSVTWLRTNGSTGARKQESPAPLAAAEPPMLSQQGQALAAARPTDVGPRAPLAAPSASGPPQRGSTPPVAAPEDFEQEMREAEQFHEREHEAALRRHRDEPKDPRWASATESKLEAELETDATVSNYKVVRVDCHTTTCVGVLEWRSYPDALRGYVAPLRRPYTVNCAQEILLPPPPNPAAPYQASMVFNCESWRAGGN